jgi:hypothetical protein
MKKTIMLIPLLLLIFSSCTPSVSESRTAFCQDMQAYGQAVRTLQTVNATTTIDELNAAREDVVEAHQELLDSASDLREAKLSSAEDAWEALQETVQNPPGNDTLGEVALTIKAEATVLNAEIARLNNVVCTR